MKLQTGTTTYAHGQPAMHRRQQAGLRVAVKPVHRNKDGILRLNVPGALQRVTALFDVTSVPFFSLASDASARQQRRPVAMKTRGSPDG
ncbi:unnamed protein product [Heligmosomoides polygyrus]|uniref:UBX domain-containing protein n=1 Tax=Heligmosomoides polygyrus TaxID=6339 RepID=A0A183FT58_HELPZ|nr:unnamed protein product [Heligmosomoides polygyrus]